MDCVLSNSSSICTWISYSVIDWIFMKESSSAVQRYGRLLLQRLISNLLVCLRCQYVWCFVSDEALLLHSFLINLTTIPIFIFQLLLSSLLTFCERRLECHLWLLGFRQLACLFGDCTGIACHCLQCTRNQFLSLKHPNALSMTGFSAVMMRERRVTAQPFAWALNRTEVVRNASQHGISVDRAHLFLKVIF